MTTYDLGDGVNLEHLVYDRDNTLTAATVTLLVTAPDGDTSTPAVTTPSTGTYRAETIVVDQTGQWTAVWSVSGTVTDVAMVTWTVADPAPPVYTNRTLVKGTIGKTTSDDRDELIDSAIVASARMIDEQTGRRFYLDTASTARVYSHGSGRITYDRFLGVWVITVDDIGSLTGLVVEVGSQATDVWTAVTGVTTGPDNILAHGRPVTEIRMPYGWEPSLWVWDARITARWGWPSEPAQIQEANRLLAARIYRRKDSPQGVFGSAEWGTIRVSRTDPDVQALIAPFCRPGFA